MREDVLDDIEEALELLEETQNTVSQFFGLSDEPKVHAIAGNLLGQIRQVQDSLEAAQAKALDEQQDESVGEDEESRHIGPADEPRHIAPAPQQEQRQQNAAARQWAWQRSWHSPTSFQVRGVSYKQVGPGSNADCTPPP